MCINKGHKRKDLTSNIRRISLETQPSITLESIIDIVLQ